MKQSSFVGTWRLVSYELRGVDGRVSYPLGQNPKGYIMYNEDGYMFVAMMSADRPMFASAGVAGSSITLLRDGTTEEKVTAAETFNAYCGRYEIRENKVIHHIEVCFLPNWIGVHQERIFEFKDNRLSLSTPSFLFGGIRHTANLVWERV